VLKGSDITSQFGIPVSTDPLDKLTTQDPLLDAKTEVQGHSLTVEWERGDILLKSITAYRELEYTEYTDLDSGAGTVGPVLLPLSVTSWGGIGVIGQAPVLDQEQWSQEFQLIGDFGDNFDYVGGVYYFLEEATKDSGSQFTVFFPQPEQEDYFDIENEAWAIYGQGTYVPDFNDDLSFTLGLRYTEDDRQASLLRLLDGEVSIDEDPDEDFQNISYTAVVNYAWDEDINTYVKLATGYKSGGYNIRASSAEGYSQGFDEEELTTLELGLKSTWMGGRLRTNVAAYYSEYDDIQLNLADITTPEDPTDTNVFNAGEAEISGIEMDVNMVLVEGLVASVSYAYQDAEFTNVDDPGDPANDEDNFVLSNAPEHQYTLGLDYDRELPLGRLAASINYNWVDDRFDTQRKSETPVTTIENYGLLGARLAWSGIDVFKGELTIAAWGKNLTDEEYLTSSPVILQPAGVYDSIGTFGEPRSWGIDVTYDFRR
jgi:iron complex outermembrane receptor protein